MRVFVCGRDIIYSKFYPTIFLIKILGETTEISNKPTSCPQKSASLTYAGTPLFSFSASVYVYYNNNIAPIKNNKNFIKITTCISTLPF